MANLKVNPETINIGDIVSVQARVIGYDKKSDTLETLIMVEFGNKEIIKVKQTDIISGPL